MRKQRKENKGIFGLIAQKCPKYMVRTPMSKSLIYRALCDMPEESYLILNTGLPFAIACTAIFAYQFFILYKTDPWGAVCTYRPFLETVITSCTVDLCAALLLDIIARKNGKR